VLPSLLFCLIANFALAQQNTGSLLGVVVDSTGGVISGVSLKITHVETGLENSVTSGENGSYVFRLLPVGYYKLEASHAGFKNFERENIRVVSGEAVSVDIALSVGATTEKITVTGEAPVLDVSSSQVGTTRTSDEIARLPITLAGNSSRSAAGFARTMAGVNFNPAESGGQDFMVVSRPQINGSMAGTWGYQIDGIDAGMGEAESGSDFMSPIPEAIDEFRLTANADSSSGFNGGVNMQMTMKSGTNQFHGTLLYYVRNDKFDARNFFDVSGKPSPNKQNEGGYAIGGPIIRNKTFFFSTMDIYRFRTSATGQIATVPTALMRDGNFSELLNTGIRIYDPSTTTPDGRGGFTRQPFSGNIIPRARLSPISLALQNYYSLPTTSGTTLNWVGSARPNLVDKDQFTIKIDHIINSKHRISGAYEAVIPWFLPELSGKSGHSFIGGRSGFLAPEIDTGFIDDRDSYRYRANYVWTVSNEVLFNARASVTRNPNRNLARFPFDGPGSTLAQTIGLKGTLSPAGPKGNMQGFNGFGPPFQQILVASQRTPVNVDVSWVRGSHNLKFGADYVALPYSLYNASNNIGTFNFTDRITGLPGTPASGSGWASFLLGEVDSATVATPIDMRAFSGGWGFFVQDQWRATRKLTVSVGLRWNLFIPLTETQDKISSFDPNLPNPKAGGRLGALSIYGKGPGRNGLTSVADHYYKAFGPTLGLAYQVMPKTVIRASFGINYLPYWQKYYGSTGPVQPTAGFSASLTATTLDNGVTPAFNWNNGFPLTFPSLPITDPSLQNGSSLGYINREENRPPYSQNLSFEIGQELPWQTSIRAAYVGNLSRRLPISTAIDLNTMPLSALRYGSLLQSSITSPEAQAAGIPLPYPGFTGSVAQALRPYPQYLGIPMIGAQAGSSNYHALQVNFQKRVGDLAFLAAYTWSKQITNTNFAGFNGGGDSVFQHPDLRDVSRQLLSKDRTQIFNLSWAYDLPFGRGKAFLSGSSPFVNQLVGGWRVSGIQNYMSGEPVRVSTRATIPGGFGGIWANYVSGQPLKQRGCADVDPGISAQARYLNPAALTTPGPFTLGNTSLLSTVRNCNFYDESLEIEKEFRIHERYRVHIGTMMMNIFNRHILGGLVTDVGNVDAFGRFTSASPPRNFQLYAKFHF